MIRSEFRFWAAWDYELEEMWLNHMAQQGWHLQKVTMGMYYTFEKGEPGAYQYRLEMLDESKNEQYLSFMEDAGIEKIGGYLWWAYFRKKNDGKAFELFSDVKSRMAHIQRIKKLMDTLKILLTVVLSLDYLLFMVETWMGDVTGVMQMFTMLPCVLICLWIWGGSKKLKYQIEALQQEQIIHE